MIKNINIPKEKVRHFTETKRLKELFCLLIWLKMQHSNGVVFNITATQLRYRLGIGKVKAERLMKDIQEADNLLSLVGNTVYVLSWRDKSVKGRGKKIWCGEKCFKFRYDTERTYTLRDIYKQLNELLTLEQINARERKDGFLSQAERLGIHETRHAARCRAQFPVTLRTMSRSNGMSVSSTRNILKGLEQRGVVRKKPCEVYYHHISDPALFLGYQGVCHFTFIHGHWGYVIKPCEWHIMEREWSECYQHVIYHYRDRRNVAVNMMETDMACACNVVACGNASQAWKSKKLSSLRVFQDYE
mgnify:CR=1 FL=1